MKSYKVIVPKPAAKNEAGTEVDLYTADEVVTPSGEWQEKLMEAFVENGWAMEVKTVQPEETVVVQAEIKAEEEAAPAPKKRGRPKKKPDPAPEVDE